jgi:hypothetical protein
MLLHMALVRTDISEDLGASIIRVTRLGEVGTLAVTSNRRMLRRNTKSFHPDDGRAKFLRNVGSYKSHTTLYLRIILHSHRCENLKSYTFLKYRVSLVCWWPICVLSVLHVWERVGIWSATWAYVNPTRVCMVRLICAGGVVYVVCSSLQLVRPL